MKKFTIILLITLILFSCKKEPQDDIFRAVITFIMNNVEKSDGTQWHKAKLLDEIDVSLVVRTGRVSKAEMNVNNRYRLMLEENTVFVPILLKSDNVNFSLKQGSVFGRIKKLFEGQKFTIVTPTLVIGVRGTDFHISSDEKGDKLSVREGSVRVRLNIKRIDELIRHSNQGVRELYKVFQENIIVEKNKSVYFEKEKLVKINDLIEKAITEANPEATLKKILQIIELKITDADSRVFINSVNHFDSNENTIGGKPIYLNGGTEATEIFINDRFIGKGRYAKLFSPGDYVFKFKLMNKIHVVKRKIISGDAIEETLKAPFTNDMLKVRTQQGQGRQGHYEANPNERAAN